MSTRDTYHNVVKQALENEGWNITADPLGIHFLGVEIRIELGAERVIAAEREGEKIAISCLSPRNGGNCSMDTIEKYREQIQKLLMAYKTPPFLTGGVETQLVVDTQQDHYQLVNVGWNNGQRVYGVVIHIDLKDGKIWLQQNLTDQLVAEDLVKLGIPKEQIVLGFQPVYMRKYTEFAVN